MAKETTKADEQIEVHLRNDWFSGARLRRPTENPHFLPPHALEELPESARVMKDGELVPVKDLRTRPTNAELAAKDKETIPVQAFVKKSELNI